MHAPAVSLTFILDYIMYANECVKTKSWLGPNQDASLTAGTDDKPLHLHPCLALLAAFSESKAQAHSEG